ncbi:NF-kappa-B inhibitor delta isoform X2 [Boleophthalmus pectinirostris]|uniref:NF-kappa-B inhibitor delta isoform X2 n=1 Tax=Boleophthalmus pectinirostris TaxID=150288 RepID=UPI000A1C32D1|nr:NF-kappa-B inhibitor delta isoform X2 [Boleophthalmus pectinirostris]
MHFEKTSKEKPCTQPTVKKLLEQKRKRETSSVLPSCSHSSLAPPTYTLSEGEPSDCPGGSNIQSEMAVSSQMWTPAQCSYPSSQPGPSYTHSYSLSGTPEYEPLSHLPTFGNTQPQPYEPLMTDLNLSSPWSVVGVGSSQNSVLNFVTPLDENKLQEATMFISGMDYSRTTEQDEDGDTMLHIYTAKGLRECAYAAAERLRSVGRLDAKEHKGKTALLVAVAANHPEIVHDLLLLGADINACDINGQTALHLAAHYGYSMVLQVLLSVHSANLEARNFEGMTPLHCAALSHCAEMKTIYTGGLSDGRATEKLTCVDLLLTAGASLLSQEIKSNKTVLHLAVKEGNIVLVRFLLRNPLANMKVFVDVKEFVNMKAHGHTALHMAAGLHGNPHQKEMMQLLLSRGADPSIRNLENVQAAHLLQRGPEGEQLKVLLKRRNTSSRRRVLSLQDPE